MSIIFDMGIGSVLKRVAGYGIKPKKIRQIRKRLGISGRSKWLRQLKRSISGARLTASSQPVSATSYQHQARTLSQLTGGV